jgi:sphingolipid 8-(E)-desaturase
MDKYRIGRIEGPWTNFTPPIRGGIFSPLADDDTSSNEDSLGSDTSSLWASSETSIEDNLGLEGDRYDLDISKTSDICTKSVPAWASEVRYRRKAQAPHLAPEAYTAQIVQEEIEDDIQDFPSLNAQTQRNITQKYQQLHKRVKQEGFYECRYIEYGKEFVRYSSIFVLFIIALRAQWFITSACLLGLFWHQIMFTAHDAGHMAITHNFVIDTLIGMFVADFCCGLSIGWWKSSHNVHHLITNHPVSPTTSFFPQATTNKFIRSTTQTSKTSPSLPPPLPSSNPSIPATTTSPSSGTAPPNSLFPTKS